MISYIRNFWLPIFIILAFSINNVFIGYKFLGVSFDRILELSFFIILLNIIYKDILYNQYYRHILFFFFGFIALRGLSIIFEISNNDFSNTEEILREYIRIIYFAIIFMLVYHAVNSKNKLLDYYLYIMLILSLIAFLQSIHNPLTDFVIMLKLDFFSNNTSNIELKHYLSEYNEVGVIPRPPGLYGSVIVLAYSLITSIIVSCYRYITTNKNIYIYMALFFYILGFITLTRSLIISTSIIVLYILWNKYEFKVFFILLLIIPILIFLNIDSRIVDFNFANEYNISRVNAFTAGFITAFSNPFYQNYEIYNNNFFIACSFYGFDNCGPVISSHNGIANIAEDFTLIGFFLFLLFVKQLFSISFKLNAPLRQFFCISIFSYLLHCCLHNNILFISEYMFLLPIVLLVIEGKKSTITENIKK